MNAAGDSGLDRSGKGAGYPVDFNRLLRPGSIALIGASATPGSLGECVLDNLEKSGYAGELHLVNPKRPVIRGRASLGSIEELPEGIDCAVLAIPGGAVLALGASLRAKGDRQPHRVLGRLC